MFKKFLKIFGIVILSLSVVMGGVVGVLALTGVLRPEFVALNSIDFSQPEYYIDSDTSIVINPIPSNSTQVELALKADNSGVIHFDPAVKAGENFIIKPIKTNGINNGGFTKLTAYYGKTIFCETTVYVDVPVQSMEIKTVENISNNTLINGTNTTLTLNYSGRSNKPYGDQYNYENRSKVFRKLNTETNRFETATYSIQEGGESFASINAETGVLTALNTGSFTIEAKSFKTYQDRIDYETHKLNGEFDNTSWSTGTVDGKNEEEYLNDLLITTTRTFTIRDVILTSITVDDPINDFDVKEIYLYETIDLTYEDIGLKLTPEVASGFNSDDMKYRLSDVKIEAVKDKTEENNDSSFSIKDLKNDNGEKIGWRIKCLNALDFTLNKTKLKFSISADGSDDEEKILSATLKIKTLENEIDSFTFKNQDDSYISNLNFFAYNNEIAFDGLNLNDLISISFRNNDKPGLYTTSNAGYVKVKYFIKDYDAENYNNRVVDCVEETGEIRNGIIKIVNAGSIEIEAKAIRVTETGETYLKNENDPKSYKVYSIANETSQSYSTPLTLNVKERLTNITLEFDESDENVIWVDCKQGYETIKALREAQGNIKLKISCTSSKEDEKYCNKLIVDMLENNELQIVKTNTEKLPNASIIYSYDPTTYNISAYLNIPYVDDEYFNTKVYEDSSKFKQLLINDVKFEIKLSDEIAVEYGAEANKFSNGIQRFSVTTARAKNLNVTSNKDDNTFTYLNNNEEEVTSNKLTYNNLDGYVMIYDSEHRVWKTFDNETEFKLYAELTANDVIEQPESTEETEDDEQVEPTKLIKPVNAGITVQSTNEDLIEISDDDIDAANDNALSNIETTQVYYNRINYKTINYDDAINDIKYKNNNEIPYVKINGYNYIYYTAVKLSFIANDDTFKVANQDHGVMQEVYIHVLLAIPE